VPKASRRRLDPFPLPYLGEGYVMAFPAREALERWWTATCVDHLGLTNPATRLVRHLHDGDSVRLELPDGETGPARVLSIRAGEAPSLDAMDAPASSLPVLR